MDKAAAFLSGEGDGGTFSCREVFLKDLSRCAFCLYVAIFNEINQNLPYWIIFGNHFSRSYILFGDI